MPQLAESVSVQQTLAALRKAAQSGSLKQQRRLLKDQDHLVDLLIYLQTKQGLSIFRGVRQKCADPEAQRSEGPNLTALSAGSAA